MRQHKEKDFSSSEKAQGTVWPHFPLPSPGNRELTPPFPTPTTCVFLPAAAGSFRAGKLKLPRPVLGLRLVVGVLRRQAESLRGTKRAEIQPPTSSVAAPNTGLLGTTTHNLTSSPLAVLKHCICHFLVIIMPLPKAHNPRCLSMVWVGRDLEDDPVPPPSSTPPPPCTSWSRPCGHKHNHHANKLFCSLPSNIQLHF